MNLEKIDEKIRLSYLLQEGLAKFGRAVDEGRFEDLKQVFTADALGIYNGRLGHETCQGLIDSMNIAFGPAGNCSGGQHNVMNVEARYISDAEAETTANFYAIQIGGGKYAGKYWSTWGEYNDFWTLTKDGWRIYKRQYTTKFSDGEQSIVGEY